MIKNKFSDDGGKAGTSVAPTAYIDSTKRIDRCLLAKAFYTYRGTKNQR